MKAVILILFLLFSIACLASYDQWMSVDNQTHELKIATTRNASSDDNLIEIYADFLKNKDGVYETLPVTCILKTRYQGIEGIKITMNAYSYGFTYWDHYFLYANKPLIFKFPNVKIIDQYSWHVPIIYFSNQGCSTLRDPYMCDQEISKKDGSPLVYVQCSYD